MFIEYNIWFDVSGIAILLVITLLYLLKNSVEDRTSLMFRLTLVFCFIATSTDLWYGIWMNGTVNVLSGDPVLINGLMSLLYFLAHVACAFIFFHYVVAVLGIRFSTGTMILSTIPYAAINVQILLNPVFHWVFSIDASGFYFRQNGVFLVYACATFYMFTAMLFLIRNSSRISTGRFYALLAFIIISFTGVVIQGFFPSMLVENYCVDLCLLFLYLSMYRPEDITDEETGLLNMRAFSMLVASFFPKKKHFHLVFIHIVESEYILDVLGEELVSELRTSISSFLTKHFRYPYVFHLDDGQFCLLYEDKKEMDKEEPLLSITRRFDRSWKTSGEQIKLTPRITVVTCPDQASRLDEIQDIFAATCHSHTQKNTVQVEELNVEAQHRIRLIDGISRNCVEEGKLEVAYQPVWDVHRNSFPYAEALVRLTDTTLGRISPEELVSIAERNGSISKIDTFVLEQVCKFLEECYPKVEGINVNLSMVECVQNTLVERITQTVRQWGILPSQIHFEVTETVANRFPNIAKKNIFALIDQGFLFCLDDFGQGYSNFDRLITLPFGIIKLDKQFISGDKHMMILMASMMNMIKQMGKKILVEGVETEEQANAAISMGADYIQGYLYAKPLTREEYLLFLSTSR